MQSVRLGRSCGERCPIIQAFVTSCHYSVSAAGEGPAAAQRASVQGWRRSGEMRRRPQGPFRRSVRRGMADKGKPRNNLGYYFSEAAGAHAGAVALIDLSCEPPRQVTYAELDQRHDRFASLISG